LLKKRKNGNVYLEQRASVDTKSFRGETHGNAVAITKLYKNALWTTLRTIFRPNMQPDCMYFHLRSQHFSGVMPRTSCAWAHNPISAWLDIVSITKRPLKSTARMWLVRASDGFREGGASRLRPPPFGRQTDAVNHGTPDMWQRYCIMATLSPVYLFKHVKHGTQNIQNDCHQWLSDSFRVHQIRLLSGLCPGPRWGVYSAPQTF